MKLVDITRDNWKDVIFLSTKNGIAANSFDHGRCSCAFCFYGSAYREKTIEKAFKKSGNGITLKLKYCKKLHRTQERVL